MLTPVGQSALILTPSSPPQLPHPQADAETPSQHLRAGPCWGPGDPLLTPLLSRRLVIHRIGEIASISTIVPP